MTRNRRAQLARNRVGSPPQRRPTPPDRSGRDWKLPPRSCRGPTISFLVAARGRTWGLRNWVFASFGAAFGLSGRGRGDVAELVAVDRLADDRLLDLATSGELAE